MFATFQAIALSRSRGMRRTERVACIPVCVGHLKERDSLKTRVVDGKIVLRFFLTK